MKLKIEKIQDRHGDIFIELTTDPSKVPVQARLDKAQVTMLANLLQSAASSTTFKFELEL